MRGRGHRKKVIMRSRTGEPTDAREALERRWYSRMERDDALTTLVTGEHNDSEPFHRWLTLRQAFSPELVRRFLSQARGRRDLPLLDPFAGGGTFVIECARQGVAAHGIEALESLVYVGRARGARSLPPLPDLGDCATWAGAADRLEEPIHRAALICAVARQHTGEGQLNRNAPPLREAMAEVTAMMAEDLRHPLPCEPAIDRGDARQLGGIENGSIGGILTSPPYLSRHDYTRAMRPHEMVYRYWHAGRDLAEKREDQVRAHPKAYARLHRTVMPPAVTEACEALVIVGEPKLAGVVRSYFEDLFAALGECARVLAEGCPCWVVVGGGRLKGVYVPSDLVLAEQAAGCGLVVDRIQVARRLIASGRRLGGLHNVAPRESVLVLRREGRQE